MGLKSAIHITQFYKTGLIVLKLQPTAMKILSSCSGDCTLELSGPPVEQWRCKAICLSTLFISPSVLIVVGPL